MTSRIASLNVMATPFAASRPPPASLFLPEEFSATAPESCPKNTPAPQERVTAHYKAPPCVRVRYTYRQPRNVDARDPKRYGIEHFEGRPRCYTAKRRAEPAGEYHVGPMHILAA